jgi:hypothetical protein
MKAITIVFFILFLVKDCEIKSQEIDAVKIEYSAYSREYYQKTEIENKKFRVFRDSNSLEDPNFQPIPKALWKEMVLEFKKLNLDAISNMEAPTKKRFHDGAAIAKLSIFYKGKAYQTVDFDRGFPPKEISKFVEKINALIKD